MGDEGSALAGTAWSLEEIGGAAAVAGVRSTVAFGTDGRVTGRGGVNRFFGSYTASADSIEFGVIGSTMMAGPPEAMEQEGRFLGELAETRPYVIDGDVLTIGEARLRRLEQVSVTGRVTYRQRIALPPDAVVVVRVLDVSRADAPSITVAEQRIPVEHQVPIPFSLDGRPRRPRSPAQLCGGGDHRDRRRDRLDVRHPPPGGGRRAHRGRDQRGHGPLLSRRTARPRSRSKNACPNMRSELHCCHSRSLSYPLRMVNG